MTKPSKEELKRRFESVSYSDDDIAENAAKFRLEKERSEAVLAAREQSDLIRMRRGWSEWTLIVIVGITVFDMALILLIGVGALSFDSGFQVPFFIGESLVKVWVLAYLVVRFLFDDKSLGGK